MSHQDQHFTHNNTAPAFEKVPHHTQDSSYIYGMSERVPNSHPDHISSNSLNASNAYHTSTAPHPSGRYPESPVSSSMQLRPQTLPQTPSLNYQQVQPQQNLIFRIGKFIPCIFIGAVISWSYYAIVIHVLFYYYRVVISNMALFIYLIIQYHVILILFIWSWLKTVFTTPASVGPDYILSPDNIREYMNLRTSNERNRFLHSLIGVRRITVVQRLDKSERPFEIRYCKKTHAVKPDRAHYDSMTKRLVLKMDHYCPWVANCIGYSNYKFFVLFLFYAIMYCFFIIAVTVKPFLQVWTTPANIRASEDTGVTQTNSTDTTEPPGFRMHCILVFLVGSVFSLSIMFLFGFHCYLISKNRTTIECYGAPIIREVGECKYAYDIGCLPNWRQVMGGSICLWLVPVGQNPEELRDGHQFPLSQLLATNQVIDTV